MKVHWFAFVSCLLIVPAFAGGNEDDTLWVTNLTDAVDSAWVVNVPTGTSDYFCELYDVIPGYGNSEHLVSGLPLTAVAVSVADFGSGRRYPTVGVFALNLALDPARCTPDLSLPIIATSSPVLPSLALAEFADFEMPEGKIPAGTDRVAAVVQLPPGDSGLLAVGADSVVNSPTCSAFTTDGFATPAIEVSSLDLGINVGQDSNADNGNFAPPFSGRLRVQKEPLSPTELAYDPGKGDHLSLTGVRIMNPGDQFEIAFFGPHRGPKKDWFDLRYKEAPTGTCPAGAWATWTQFPAPGWKPSQNDADGDGCFARISATWNLPTPATGNCYWFKARYWHWPASPHGFTNCVRVDSN